MYYVLIKSTNRSENDMKFPVRKNEKVTIYSEIFETREEAENHISSDEEGTSFVHDSIAKAMGYPCGGFIVKDAWNNPKELHLEAA